METSLHRELKQHYADGDARIEVPRDGYRIDVVRGDELIEIQHGSLAAIREKVRRLLTAHHVLIVKPIIANKRLVRFSAPGGEVLSRRASPKRGTLRDIFEELVYFTHVFPHPRLSIEVVLVDVEEWRVPGHGRRRRWRKNDQVVADQKLLSVGASVRLADASDLLTLLPTTLPRRFHSGELAAAMGIRRHVAQRIAYCLREMKAVRQVGKQGNTLIYEQPARRKRRGSRAA